MKTRRKIYIYIYPIRRIFGETEEVKNEEIRRKWGETKR